MKVEKINDNKIKITLTFEELERRKISLKDIEKDASLAKDLFIDLIEESNLEEEFIIDDSQLFIEASSDNNNLFIVTITKVDNIPELKKYALLEDNFQTKSNKTKSSYKTNKNNSAKKYKVDSNVYSFSSIDNILSLCLVAKNEKIFLGKNSLYKYNDTYFIIFSRTSIKNPKFLKTYVFLSEYCKDYFNYDMLEISIKEKSQLIIENKALQNLMKI